MIKVRAIVTRAPMAVRSLLIALPTLLRFVFDKRIGGAYGVGVRKKLELVRAFRRNATSIEVLSAGVEHIELAGAILRIPPGVPGDVIECGCYVGGSSTNLSLTCALVGRRLVICDSFEGLPEPSEDDREHVSPHIGYTDVYYKGRFAASLDTVKDNIGRFGDLSVCDFVVGFFEHTLPGLDRPIAMGFLDVDFVDSLKPCITGIWPNLHEDSRLYVHEARSLSLVSVFFDVGWWRENLGIGAPGFIGAGSGLPLTSGGSELGYAQKGVVAVPA